MIRTVLILTGLIICNLLTLAQTGGNYIIIINNDSIRVNLGDDHLYTTSSGEDLNLKVIQPDILNYSDDMISFKYFNSLSVSNTKIEEGVEQCVIVKSTGNGFMVQKYKTIDPRLLTRLMLNELIKESISYGYTKTETKFTKKLLSGQTIEGFEAILTYKGQKEYYTVASYGAKDEGIIVVTMLLSEDFPEDKQFIELFLNTLKIKE